MRWLWLVGLLAGWRVGDRRSVVVVVVVVICTRQKSSREGASRVSSVVAFWPHRAHNYRASGKRTSHVQGACGGSKYVSRNLWLCVNAECGWLARGGRTPHSEQSVPGPSPVQRSAPLFSVPSVAAIYLTDHTFQRAICTFLTYPYPPL